MRALRYAVLASLLASILLIAQPAQAWHNGFGGIDADHPTGTNLVSSDGLVLSYNMEDLTRDGEMYDFSGQGNHGTITGTTDMAGTFGRARDFDGDDVIEASDSPELQLTNEAGFVTWVNLNTQNQRQTLLDKSRFRYSFQVSDTNLLVFFIGGIGYTTNSQVPANQTVILAATFDSSLSSGNVRLFIDGSLDNTLDRTDPISTDTTSLRVGQDHSGSRVLNGTVDEALLFSRALSDAEIRYLSTADIHEFGVPATSIPLTTAIGIHGLSTTVTLQADSDCATCFYRWDMGDGHVRDGPTVTHSYDVRGLWAVYYPTLEVCNFSGTVCEERSFRIVLVNWPAAAVMGFLFGGVLIVIGKRQRWYRVVRMR